MSPLYPTVKRLYLANKDIIILDRALARGWIIQLEYDELKLL